MRIDKIKTYDSIIDANGNELLDFLAAAGAVNYLKLLNSATGDGVELQAQGDDTNIDLNLTPKGTGGVGIGASPGARLSVYNNSNSDPPGLGNHGGTAEISRDSNYGLLIGTSGTGTSWIQVQRTDGTATAYDLQLQPSGGNVSIGNNLSVTGKVTANGFDASSNKITSVTDPTANQDAATKKYVDDNVGMKPNSGTSFPADPDGGDVFYRTDLKALYVFVGVGEPGTTSGWFNLKQALYAA